MINTYISGVNKNATPLSEAFTLDVIDEVVNIEKELHSVNKIIISTSYKYLESFNILNKFYVNILITIDIRTDYLCKSKNINYAINKIQKIICISTGDLKCNKTVPIKFDIIDSGIINIYENKFNLYLLYLVSLDLS